MMRAAKKLVKRIIHKRQDFNTRMQMERNAQHDVATRLKAIEIRYQLESRQQGKHRN